MNAHRVEAVINQDRTLTLRDLPFKAGDAVEVIILERDGGGERKYALRGTPLSYEDPTEPVAAEDWHAAT